MKRHFVSQSSRDKKSSLVEGKINTGICIFPVTEGVRKKNYHFNIIFKVSISLFFKKLPLAD